MEKFNPPSLHPYPNASRATADETAFKPKPPYCLEIQSPCSFIKPHFFHSFDGNS